MTDTQNSPIRILSDNEDSINEIAVNADNHGHSLLLLDGVTEQDGKLGSCVDGQCHTLDSDTSASLKKRALAESAPGEMQYWYTEGLAAFLNNQSMLHKRELTPLFTVTHNEGGASIKWESSLIYTWQEGNDTLIVGPEANYTLSDPSELLEHDTILGLQEFIKNNVPYEHAVSTASFLWAIGADIAGWVGNSRKNVDRKVLSLGRLGYLTIINGDSRSDFRTECILSEQRNFGNEVGLPPGAMCGRVFTQNKERAWTLVMGADYNGVAGVQCLGYRIEEWEYSSC